MMDFFNKLENFLFDVLGLVLPGFILLIIAAAPLLLFDFSCISEELLQRSGLLSTFDILSAHITVLKELDRNILIGLILLLSYILGHVVKVFSIIFYEIGQVIFDNLLVTLINWIAYFLLRRANDLFEKAEVNNKNTLTEALKKLFELIKNTFRKIFMFGSPSYFPANEPLVKESVRLINEKLSTKYPEVWYSLYKFSMVINHQEKLKSLSGFFLAKYNLYRSLSFIFVLAYIYFNIFYLATDLLLTDEVKSVKNLIQIAFVLLWFTFHVKFKRYWTLCGNETLISLYYFLNRGLLRKEGISDEE